MKKIITLIGLCSLLSSCSLLLQNNRDAAQLAEAAGPGPCAMLSTKW